MKKFNPKASWRLVQNNYAEVEASSLRPDTILIKDTNAYILDSKFYRFGFTGKKDDLPETTSIQKQITYGDYLIELKKNEKVNVENIYNAFIIPYDKLNNNFGFSQNIEYIGYAKTEWNSKEKSHQFVYTFLVDLYHVVKTWNDYNHNDDINALVDGINAAIKANVDLK